LNALYSAISNYFAAGRDFFGEIGSFNSYFEYTWSDLQNKFAAGVSRFSSRILRTCDLKERNSGLTKLR
jgi:hypothetical protein